MENLIYLATLMLLIYNTSMIYKYSAQIIYAKKIKLILGKTQVNININFRSKYSRIKGCISLFLPRMPKSPHPFEWHWLAIKRTAKVSRVDTSAIIYSVS